MIFFNFLTLFFIANHLPLEQINEQISIIIINSSMAMKQQKIESQNEQDNSLFNIGSPKLKFQLTYPMHLRQGLLNPILNKIVSSQDRFYCGYSNGVILTYAYESDLGVGLLDRDNKNSKLIDASYPYQNLDVIDMQVYNQDTLLLSTHTEVTLYNYYKNKRMSLKGHQESVIGVTAHPVSPIVFSVSNLIIQHDLRMQKPISVNFITPPVYGIQCFADGQYFLLPGEPCRIGRQKWMRTLHNGMATVSKNSKFVLANQMNGQIILWDWRKSQPLRQIKQVKNKDTYQPIHFKMEDQKTRKILFLEDDGNLLQHQILKNKTQRHRLINPKDHQNWKSQISSQGDTTKHLLLYQHQSTTIKCYQL